VDWDGDGKKDFIGAGFENSIIFYKNIGSGGVGVAPQFANASGVALVASYTPQMVSGADAKDFNGDGDLDIVTGQGHGGSNLRFYERDYINDTLNSTSPTVTQSSSERGYSVSEARSLADGATVLLPKMIVSACYTGYFYVESPERLGGLRVQLADHGRTEGECVDVRGAIWTNAAGERYIAPTSITPNPY
jgi:hypothetical protein